MWLLNLERLVSKRNKFSLIINYSVSGILLQERKMDQDITEQGHCED